MPTTHRRGASPTGSGDDGRVIARSNVVDADRAGAMHLMYIVHRSDYSTAFSPRTFAIWILLRISNRSSLCCC
jgi:hypothetical protein